MRKHKLNIDTESDSEFDLTSLLDALFIVLVFILASFSESNLSQNVIDQLSLPYSKALGVPKESLSILVNNNGELVIDNKKLCSINTDSESIVEEQIKTVVKNSSYSQESDKTKWKVNLFLDESLEYRNIKKLLNSLTNIGFHEFKFVVRGE